jgi:flavin-dependent dehydrogenase
MMYDAIVVGARCAGAAAAMLLARKGYKVLLLDRARFPSDIPHGHFIHRQGPRRLKEWGLLDKIVATNCPPILTQLSDFDDFPLVGRDLVVDGVALGYGPRRKVLDKIMVDAAIQAGAEYVVAEGDRVVGIRGRGVGASSLSVERARITIGADGRNSLLARVVRAPFYEAVPTILCYYFSYWSGAPSSGLEVYTRLQQRRIIFNFPTNDDLFAIFVGYPIEEFHQVRADIEGNFTKALGLVPDLAERVAGGRRAERFYGMADLPNFFRKPHGPGWALVGDAGCHKDPLLALGICDAFRDVEFLTDAIDAGLSGRRPLEEALADYESWRNEASVPDYQRNIDLARFTPPPPEVYQLRAAVRGNSEDTKRFILATQGTIPREEFFNPQNMQRIMSQARKA